MHQEAFAKLDKFENCTVANTHSRNFSKIFQVSQKFFKSMGSGESGSKNNI